MDKRFAIVQIKSGKIVNTADLVKFLAQLKDGKYWIKARSQKSVKDNQRSLYRVWLVMVWEETKIIPDDLHEYFKYKFVPMISEEAAGSTENLSSEEYMVYMTLVHDYVFEYYKIDLPDGTKHGN